MCQKSKQIFIIVAVIIVLKGSICQVFKLPNLVRPSKYHLELQTDIQDGNTEFSAKVAIYIDVFEDVVEVVLHSLNLTVESVEIWNIDGVEPLERPISFTFDKDQEIMKITGVALAAGSEYILKIAYAGKFHKNFIGAYKSQVTNATNHFLTLSFQSAKFHYICPSFDEMDIRTVFEIEIKHHKNYHAISSSEKIKHSQIIEQEDYVITKFEETESLPLSSIAIIVSNFKSISTTDLQKIEIYGDGELIDACYLRDAMNTAFGTIKIMYNYFKPAYELICIKLVIIPDIVSEVSPFELIIYNQYHLIYQSFRMMTTQRDKMLYYITRTFAVS